MRCPGCGRRIWRGGVILDKNLWHRQCEETAGNYERLGYNHAVEFYGLREPAQPKERAS